MESIRVFFRGSMDFPMNDIFRFCFTFWKPPKRGELGTSWEDDWWHAHFWKTWRILTPLKTNIDTKNDGLENVSPFKHGYVG